MKYYSEKLNTLYDSIADLTAAEKKAEEKRIAEERKKAEEEKKKKQEATERKEMAAKVEEARKALAQASKEYIDLLTKFCETYGSYHCTLYGDDFFKDPIGKLFKSLFVS